MVNDRNGTFGSSSPRMSRGFHERPRLRPFVFLVDNPGFSIRGKGILALGHNVRSAIKLLLFRSSVQRFSQKLSAKN